MLTGVIDDPGSLDTHTLQINWGDPLSPGNVQTIDLTVATPGVTYNAETREFAIEHQYLDDNPTGTGSDSYTIRVTVTDDDTGGGIAETAVVVTNVAPVIGETTDATIKEGTAVSIGIFADNPEVPFLPPISFGDVGTLDTHTAVIEWGDGTGETPLSVVGFGHARFLLGDFHTFADNGVYTATIT